MKLHTSIVMLLLLLLTTACSAETEKAMNDITKAAEDQAADIASSNNPYVLSVKNGHFIDYPKRTLEEAFEGFFGSPTWKHFEADTGEQIVEFTGFMIYEEAEVKARLQFIVNEDTSFEPGALSFNDVPQNELTTNAVIAAVFKDETDQSAK